MKKVVIVLLVVALMMPMMASAETNLIEFTELYVKRMMRFNPDYELSPLLHVFSTGDSVMATTSAGLIKTDEKFNITYVSFSYDPFNVNSEDLSPLYNFIIGMSCIEHSDMEEGLMGITGRTTPVKEAATVYKDEIAPILSANIAKILLGEEIKVYESGKAIYHVNRIVDKDMKPTGGAQLSVTLK